MQGKASGISNGTRVCTKCGKSLPLSEFRREKRTKTGYQSSCKACEKAYRDVHSARPEIKEQKRETAKRRRERKAAEQSANPALIASKAVCCTCGLTKLASDFPVCRGRNGGINCQCKECYNKASRKRDAELKKKVVDHLGGCCCRCGFSDIRALQVDHVNGGGAEERRELKGKNIKIFYDRVLADTEGKYQLLCGCCNWIKRFENGEQAFRKPIENPDARTKVCCICHRERSISYFYGCSRHSDGLASQCVDCHLDRCREYSSSFREKIFDKLGHACSCGYSDKRALQIDHVNGGGSREWQEVKSNVELYKRVLADTTGAYQILCVNCNWIKRYENRELYIWREKRELVSA